MQVKEYYLNIKYIKYAYKYIYVQVIFLKLFLGSCWITYIPVTRIPQLRLIIKHCSAYLKFGFIVLFRSIPALYNICYIILQEFFGPFSLNGISA